MPTPPDPDDRLVMTTIQRHLTVIQIDHDPPPTAERLKVELIHRRAAGQHSYTVILAQEIVGLADRRDPHASLVAESDVIDLPIAKVAWLIARLQQAYTAYVAAEQIRGRAVVADPEETQP